MIMYTELRGRAALANAKRTDADRLNKKRAVVVVTCGFVLGLLAVMWREHESPTKKHRALGRLSVADAKKIYEANDKIASVQEQCFKKDGGKFVVSQTSETAVKSHYADCKDTTRKPNDVEEKVKWLKETQSKITFEEWRAENERREKRAEELLESNTRNELFEKAFDIIGGQPEVDPSEVNTLTVESICTEQPVNKKNPDNTDEFRELFNNYANNTTDVMEPKYLQVFLGNEAGIHMEDDENYKIHTKICQAWSKNREKKLNFEEFHRMFDYIICSESLNEEITEQKLRNRANAWKWVYENGVTEMETGLEEVQVSEKNKNKEVQKRSPDEKEWIINMVGTLQPGVWGETRDQPLTPEQLEKAKAIYKDKKGLLRQLREKLKSKKVNE